MWLFGIGCEELVKMFFVVFVCVVLRLRILSSCLMVWMVWFFVFMGFFL